MSVWDGDGEWVTVTPDRDAVALSAAQKIALLIGIVAAVIALWAVTSPAAQSQTADPTLGPPIATTHTVADRGGR